MDSDDVADIREKIKDIIVSVADFEIDKKTIGDGEKSIRKLGLNSLALLRLLARIESTFEIETDPEETGPSILSAVDELAEYVAHKVNLKR